MDEILSNLRHANIKEANTILQSWYIAGSVMLQQPQTVSISLKPSILAFVISKSGKSLATALLSQYFYRIFL